ncbi:hypothetical protein [Aestuariibius sp. HNIBRBA575]|uniref:hypothetical protein n=1 Tax=Aestuariibius sp. HNIBRBA575 TaxID=3233343 RepID=UPI0034A47FEB
MKRPINIKQNRPRFVCAVFGYVVVALFALQMVLPSVAAAHMQGQSGNWIVICGEFGPERIQVSTDGQAISENTNPTLPCANCDTCPDCNSVASRLEPSLTQIGERLASHSGAKCISQTEFSENPAQFWGQNRGPPKRNPTDMNCELTPFARPALAGV